MADEEWKPKAGDLVEATEDLPPCWNKGVVFLLNDSEDDGASFTCLETAMHDFHIEKSSFKLCGHIESRESKGVPNPDLEHSFDIAIMRLMEHPAFRAQLNLSVQDEDKLITAAGEFLDEWFHKAGFIGIIQVCRDDSISSKQTIMTLGFTLHFGNNSIRRISVNNYLQ